MPGLLRRDENGQIWRTHKARTMLLSLNGTVWKPHKEMKSTDGGTCRKPGAGEVHPSFACTCGIYAHALREQTIPELKDEMDRTGKTGHDVYAFGRVALRGNYVRGDKGFRAEFAYPYDIYLIDVGDPSLAREVANQYAIDVQHGPAPMELRSDSEFNLEVAGGVSQPWTSGMQVGAGTGGGFLPTVNPPYAPNMKVKPLPSGSLVCQRHGAHTGAMCPACLSEVRPRRGK